ncbi:hypothetical protein NQ317_013504 [Molorchus minor]|uniref:Uncharacterized protein n=1 Tax=Molorchus minor TaxID=1323400 RepID=A0ABQ9JWW8_9CUCU|nr:hypothetical protein NQ317_013504 [Molorchus minor]
MGKTFLGNPYSDAYDDNELDTEDDDDWVTMHQLIPVYVREQEFIIYDSSDDEQVAEFEESFNDDPDDEDYVPDEDILDADNSLEDDRLYFANDDADSDDYEDIDYVTFPIRDPPPESDRTAEGNDSNTAQNDNSTSDNNRPGTENND